MSEGLLQAAPGRDGLSGRTSALLRWGAALGLALGLAATLYTYMMRHGFNEDELFQVAFLNQPFPGFFALFIRLDQHPPFHFLQLVPWSWISGGDGWLLFNSVAWHLVSCAALWYVGRSWMGGAAGLVAVALYALMPQVVSASTTLRFYAMIPALAVLSWWLHVSLLSGPARGSSRWWALAVLQVALAYSHAIAFYFVFWIALAAAVQQWSALGGRAPWRRWLLVQAGVLAVVLPQVLLTAARAYMARGTGDTIGGNNDPGSLIDHFGGMTAGWGMQWAWARGVGAGVYAAAVLVGLWRPATRWLTALLLIGPYAVAALIGMVLAPMFKTPVYSAMLVPFACLALAGGLAQAATGWRVAPALVLLAAMAAFVLPASQHLNRGISPYRAIAAELTRVARPGDVVVVPQPYLYWAVMRYAVAPDWGAPLDVLPPLSGSWLGLTQRLGQPVSSALKLVPRTDRIEHRGITYVIGNDASQVLTDSGRVWLVERSGRAAQPRLAAGYVAKGSSFKAGQPEATEILLFEREAK